MPTGTRSIKQAKSYLRVDRRPKSSIEGQSNVKSSPRGEDDQSCLRVDEKRLPMGGKSNIKSSPRGKDNDLSCLRVDGRPKPLTGGRSNIKSSPKGKYNDQSCLWEDSPT